MGEGAPDDWDSARVVSPSSSALQTKFVQHAVKNLSGLPLMSKILLLEPELKLMGTNSSLANDA